MGRAQHDDRRDKTPLRSILALEELYDKACSAPHGAAAAAAAAAVAAAAAAAAVALLGGPLDPLHHCVADSPQGYVRMELGNEKTVGNGIGIGIGSCADPPAQQTITATTTEAVAATAAAV